MRRLSLFAALAVFASVLAASERPAKADVAYVYASDALPWHYGARTDVPAGETGTNTVQGTPFGLDSLAFGAGIGYTGLNGQLDVHNVAHLWTGAATVGLRAKLGLGPVELWGRAGIGLGLVFDTINPAGVKTTGAIATDFEAGADVFFIPHLGLGLKAIFTPQYSFPSTLSTDVALAIEVRARF